MWDDTFQVFEEWISRVNWSKLNYFEINLIYRCLFFWKLLDFQAIGLFFFGQVLSKTIRVFSWIVANRATSSFLYHTITRLTAITANIYYPLRFHFDIQWLPLLPLLRPRATMRFSNRKLNVEEYTLKFVARYRGGLKYWPVPGNTFPWNFSFSFP